MSNQTSTNAHELKPFRTLRDDVRRSNFPRTIGRDYRELKEFYLTDERRKRLASMGWLRRVLYMLLWLLQSLFDKLTPARRLLVVIAVVIVLLSNKIHYSSEHLNITIDFSMLGGLIILFVLMLELKDKLIARSELEAGRAVQRALMPESSPVVPGWSVWLFTQTANEVGGDLVDFQKLDEQRCRIALADVAGKGLSAALFTSKLQATIRAFAPEVSALNQLGAKINRIFHRDSVRNTFASLAYVEVVADTNRVRLINAGHLPPVVLRNGSLVELPKGEPAIGIFPEITYSEHLVEMQPGDVMVMYSDGLSEAKNMAGEFYGTERLFRLLPSIVQPSGPVIGERIVREVQEFVGDAPVNDDLSLVVLKRT
jgi:sigma-B regulation protein RsbU (phosphoserine phosphatase)